MTELACKTCGRTFTRRKRSLHCSKQCAQPKKPVVYRYVCPDGRSYVGAVLDSRHRFDNGIQRSNPRLEAAYEQHPPESFTCEILATLTPGCAGHELREAEQRWMDYFRSWSPDSGFNIEPASWNGNSPGQQAGRERHRAIMAQVRENLRKLRIQ